MECRRCAACDRAFRPRAQIPHQRYCALAACQRERRRRWQLSKLHSDADYRATISVRRSAPGRMAMASTGVNYRASYILITPIATVLRQRRRDRGRRATRLAKMDASTHDKWRSFRDLPSVGRDW